MDRINLLGASLEELRTVVQELGEPAYRARQIYGGIYRRLLRSWNDFTDLGRHFREKLADRFEISGLLPQQVFVSQDGTRRFLFEVDPGQKIESVFIPEERRDTICISTQVGCAVGCLFCVTGKLRMRRNLRTGEIVAQILSLQADRGAATRRLNIVIMGMGEPMNNYENVMRAIRLMTDRRGNVHLPSQNNPVYFRRNSGNPAPGARARDPEPGNISECNDGCSPQCAHTDQQKMEYRSAYRNLPQFSPGAAAAHHV